MVGSKPHGSVSEWVDELLSKGKNAFSLQQVKESFPEHSEAALKRSLNRPYYISLLSAAALYGAAHQAPQVFMVNTTFPALRPSAKKNSKIKFISIKEIPAPLLEQKKTESGYVQVSSPELTALDLVNFTKQIGGLSRAATVINELVEYIRLEKINEEWASHAETATLQRLGYIADEILHQQPLADAVEDICQKLNLKFFRVSLMAKGKRYGFPCDDRWKVIENSVIEID